MDWWGLGGRGGPLPIALTDPKDLTGLEAEVGIFRVRRVVLGEAGFVVFDSADQPTDRAGACNDTTEVRSTGGKVDRPGCNDKEYEHEHTATDEDPSWGAHPQAAGLWEQQRICERVLRGILNDGRR